ncbi:MAG TPA: mandelate racemase/muconate lactonizing enzyme family protein, partial [Actinomycetota bacterium]
MIARIDAYPLRYAEPHYRGMERCVTLVRIETSDGTVGWGESISQFPEAAVATKVLIDEGFAPRISGRDPLDVELLWKEMCTYAYWFGVEGIAAFAISAIDMALWDLKGKILGQPVYRLLGGAQRRRIRVYANGWYTNPGRPELNAEEAKTVVAMGYTALKFDPFGQHNYYTISLAEAQLAEDRVAAVREAVGPEVDI